MEATNTDFYAYQFKPVLKLLQTPTNGILIADVVGLGKTIEAGLIWTELRSRFNLNRLVILCPTALREKWHDELTNKMGLSPQICNAKEMLLILKDEKAHAKGFSIIASTQGLSAEKGLAGPCIPHGHANSQSGRSYPRSIADPCPSRSCSWS